MRYLSLLRLHQRTWDDMQARVPRKSYAAPCVLLGAVAMAGRLYNGPIVAMDIKVTSGTNLWLVDAATGFKNKK